MTREEVYDKCIEKIAYVKGRGEEPIIYKKKTLLPRVVIDAIIDCAVEEAVKALRGEQK